MDASAGHREFIVGHTALTAPPLVPEVRLHLATEVTPLWEATESFLDKTGLPPPYWAFAWPGGQALARWVLDHPQQVRGKRVLSFAAGSGVEAIACALAGAASVEAAEIDAFAIAALGLNAAANGVTVAPVAEDLTAGAQVGRWDLVLAGDVCYERPMADAVLRWLGRLNTEVVLADPGRAYLPKSGLTALATYAVPTSLDLEDRAERVTVVYRWGG